MENEIQKQIEIRKQRGMEIANSCRIVRRDKGGFIVPSQSGSGTYLVQYINYKPKCNCQDFEKRGILLGKCKHCWAVEITLNKKVYEDGTTVTTRTVKMTYPQNWKAYNTAQMNEKGLFMNLMADLCKEIPNPEYVFGRPNMPIADMVFCSAFKVYSTFSGRRFTTDMQIAKERGYIDKVPHYNSVFNYMQKEELTPVLLDLIVKSSMPLKAVESDFAVDSSGFSTCRFERWFNFKYGKEISSRIWVKAHVMSGVKTNVITSVSISEAHANDSPYFAELVKTTSENFEIKEVSADKAYSSRENMEIVDSVGAVPFIPFRKNVTGKPRGSTTWKKMYHFFMFQREEFLEHYHKRSNAETVFHMIKAKFGDAIRSKTKTAQVNEVLLKILCHNVYVVIQEMHNLGIEPMFSAQKVGGD